MLIATLFITPKTKSDSNVDEKQKDSTNVHTRECYSAIENSELPILTAVWMDLKTCWVRQPETKESVLSNLISMTFLKVKTIHGDENRTMLAFGGGGSTEKGLLGHNRNAHSLDVLVFTHLSKLVESET